MVMRDPWNPQQAEIREWAYSEDQLEPDQDWDLVLANLDELDLYLEIAADDACPNWGYFLRVLYLVVGDAVRTEFQTESREDLEALLEATRAFAKRRFDLLRERAEDLIARPETFDYDNWCLGGFVRRDLRAGLT